jgi:hypothetical protein
MIAFFSLHFIWVPFNLPNGILPLFGGFMFSKMYGKIIGYIICVSLISSGYILAALFSFCMGRKYFKNII